MIKTYQSPDWSTVTTARLKALEAVAEAVQEWVDAETYEAEDNAVGTLLNKLAALKETE